MMPANGDAGIEVQVFIVFVVLAILSWLLAKHVAARAELDENSAARLKLFLQTLLFGLAFSILACSVFGILLFIMGRS